MTFEEFQNKCIEMNCSFRVSYNDWLKSYHVEVGRGNFLIMENGKDLSLVFHMCWNQVQDKIENGEL